MKIRKLIAAVLTLCMVLCWLPAVNVNAATYSGTCGDSLTWSLDTETGVLTIEGTGEMWLMTGTEGPFGVPWLDYANDVKSVVLPDGLTNIGFGMFVNCMMESITIPETVTIIEHGAFWGCRNLKSVSIPNNVTKIISHAFIWCTNLSSVHIPYSMTEIGDSAFEGCEALKDVYISSEAITEQLTSADACGQIIQYAENIYINSNITSVPEYLKNGFPYSSMVEVEGVSYTRYSVNPGESPKAPNPAEDMTITIGDKTFTAESGKWVYNTEVTMATSKNYSMIIFDKNYEGTFFTNGYGVAIVLDQNGVLVKIYDGVSKAFWTEDGKSNEPLTFTSLDYATVAFSELQVGELLIVFPWEAGTISAARTWALGLRYGYMGQTATLTGFFDGAAHVHSYEAVITTPGCTEGGYTTYICDCGDSYVGDYTEAAGHSYGQAVQENVQLDAHGDVASYDAVWYCTSCGEKLDSKTVTIPLGEHTYRTIVIAPTCTAWGCVLHICVDGSCTASYADEYQPALGHDYVGDVTAPTCTEGGYTSYHCSRCEEAYVGDYTEALGHGSFKLVFNGSWPTCTEDADWDVFCEACGEQIPDEEWQSWNAYNGWQKLGHNYAPATCTEPELCTRCGEAKEGSEALGHVPAEEWIIVKESTTEETGLQHKLCTVCGEVAVEEVIPVKEDSAGTGDGTMMIFAIFAMVAMGGLTVVACKKKYF